MVRLALTLAMAVPLGVAWLVALEDDRGRRLAVVRTATAALAAGVAANLLLLRVLGSS